MFPWGFLSFWLCLPNCHIRASCPELSLLGRCEDPPKLNRYLLRFPVLEQKLYLDPVDFDQPNRPFGELPKTPDSGMSDSPAVNLNGQQTIVILFSLFNDLP